MSILKHLKTGVLEQLFAQDPEKALAIAERLEQMEQEKKDAVRVVAPPRHLNIIQPGVAANPTPGGVSSMASGYAQAAGSQPVDPTKLLADALKNASVEHKALIEVMEFLSAQLQMDLWQSKPHAKQIYTTIINRGFQEFIKQALHGMGWKTEVSQ